MQEIQRHIQEVCQRLFSVEVVPELTIPDEQFGDYATNVAMHLASRVGQAPRAIAEQIVAELASEKIESAMVAGPGFINIVLSNDSLLGLAESIEVTTDLSGKTIVAETNNPNPFKAMHVGHGYNAVAADTIANLLEKGGANVHRVSYHGDIGAHVGKSMYSLLRYVDGDPSKLADIPKPERNTFMSRMYAEGAKAYKEDPSAKQEIDQLAEQSFNLEDDTYRQIYETCKTWSFEEIDSLVARLGNQRIEKRYLESQAEELGVPIVRDNVGKVFIESDGALVFPGEQYGIFDNAFVSSRGRGLYGARDLGLMQLKHQDYQPDKNYIVTAHEQKDYFRGVIKAVDLCFPEQKDVIVNIPTGELTLKGGKMSSRSGDVIEVQALFDQLETALAEQESSVTDEIVQGAIRYQFLKHRISSNVVFDINESINTVGNSGPYLQYAHCRARSILEKVTFQPASTDAVNELEPAERSLLRKLSHYSLAATKATQELSPHIICTYLYELAQNYNRFYEHNRVLGDEREAIRLQLVSRYAETLKDGLGLLGIPAPEHM